MCWLRTMHCWSASRRCEMKLEGVKRRLLAESGRRYHGDEGGKAAGATFRPVSGMHLPGLLLDPEVPALGGTDPGLPAHDAQGVLHGLREGGGIMMILVPSAGTGRAECRECFQRIEMGEPCLEVLWADGSWRCTRKICLSCLRSIVRRVEEESSQSTRKNLISPVDQHRDGR